MRLKLKKSDLEWKRANNDGNDLNDLEKLSHINSSIKVNEAQIQEDQEVMSQVNSLFFVLFVPPKSKEPYLPPLQQKNKTKRRFCTYLGSDMSHKAILRQCWRNRTF